MRAKVSSSPSTETTTSTGETSSAPKSVSASKRQSNGAAKLAADGGLPNKRGSNGVANGAVADVGKNRAKKVKKIRYSCQLPENEYAALQELKNRLAELEISVKKSELVRAGLQLLASLPERRIKTEIAKIIDVKVAQKK